MASMKPQKQNFQMQMVVVTVAVLLFGIKGTAYFLTHSLAILTDALESTVNVVAGFIGLYSLYVAAKPRDADHPYGHGKAEFLSAAIEGTLIIMAGLIIIYESVIHLINPRPIHELDYGIILVAATAVVNFVTGYLSIRRGKRNESLALIASGKHLQSDTWSTLGIIAGLGLLYVTGQWWIDNAIALLFAIIIIYTGYKILRRSVAGIMDEADIELLNRLVVHLNENRQVNWIDLHNLRVIKYGSTLHVDAHLTVPWYLNVREAHKEVDALGQSIREAFGERIELFIHTDGCLEYSCPICSKTDCSVRQHPFRERVPWTLDNMISDEKHRLPVSRGKEGLRKTN